MARVFRSMLRDGRQPVVGPSGDALGARVAPHPCEAAPCHSDIHPGGQGQVSPDEVSVHGKRPRVEGMSVAPDWRELPAHRIPKRLRALVRDACGKNALFCWEMGAGPFAPGEVGPGLRLHPDSPSHGVIAPAVRTHVDAYQQSLAATRAAWQIIAEDPLR